MILEVKQSGLDFLTATAREKDAIQNLYDYGEYVTRLEFQNGNERRPWRFLDYEGLHCGDASVGLRSGGCIVSLSGPIAHEHAPEIGRIADNVSRLDVQATFVAPKGVAQYLLKTERAANAFTKKWAKRPTVRLIRVNKEPQTIYFGSRQSDNFGRIYNRERKTRCPDDEGLVRAEREVKGGLARRVFASLARDKFDAPAIAGSLREWYRTRGVALPFDVSCATTIVAPRRVPDCERSLAWLQVCVRPTVQRLIRRMGVEAVANCLLTEEDLDHLGNSHERAEP